MELQNKIEQIAQKEKRKPGRKKGETGNPHGRPPAGQAFVEQLRVAIVEVGAERGKTLMRHAVEQAYVDNVVLVALVKKLIPDEDSDAKKEFMEALTVNVLKSYDDKKINERNS